MQKPWINTDIEEVTPSNLNKLGLKNFEISLHIRGINGGIYNAERNCYYPRDTTTNKGIAEYNKLEKLFRKWGFSSFH